MRNHSGAKTSCLLLLLFPRWRAIFFSHFHSIAGMLLLATLWGRPRRQQQQQQRPGGMPGDAISSMNPSTLPHWAPFKKSCEHEKYQFRPRNYNISVTPLWRQNDRVRTRPFKGVKNIIHFSNEFRLCGILPRFPNSNGQLCVHLKNITISQAAATFTSESALQKSTRISKRNASPSNFSHESPMNIAF